MKKSKLVLGMSMGMLMGFSTTMSQASTVFTATDGDINFLFGSLGHYSLAMFDSEVTHLSTNNALFVSSPSRVIIETNSSNDFTATNEVNESIVLGSSTDFFLAITADSGENWLMDTGYTDHGANSYTVQFNQGENSILSVDISPNPVPLPAAVWLFATGLLGLVGVARRKV